MKSLKCWAIYVYPYIIYDYLYKDSEFQFLKSRIPWEFS